MAELSNQLMALTVLAYLAAMVCHAAEYAFGDRSHVGRAAARPARDLVGAGAPVVAGTSDLGPPPPYAVVSPVELVSPVQPARGRGLPAWGHGIDRGAWAGRVAVAVFALGALAHLGTLVTRGVAADRMPWGNMYEFILSVTFVGAVAWLG